MSHITQRDRATDPTAFSIKLLAEVTSVNSLNSKSNLIKITLCYAIIIPNYAIVWNVCITMNDVTRLKQQKLVSLSIYYKFIFPYLISNIISDS